MSTEQQITRRCKDCPTWTQIVCRHAFGVYRCIKSDDGEGCDCPLDGVAESWRKAGWQPGKGKSIPITLPVITKTPIAHKRNNYVQETMLFSSVRGDPSPRSDPPPLSDDDY